MADLRVTGPHDNSREVPTVTSDGGNERGQREQPREQRPHNRAPGAEELAVALTEEDRGAMEAHYEEDAEGNPLIRIVDSERDETVAVLTPEELVELAKQTGLPPGLLVHATS